MKPVTTGAAMTTRGVSRLNFTFKPPPQAADRVEFGRIQDRPRPGAYHALVGDRYSSAVALAYRGPMSTTVAGSPSATTAGSPCPLRVHLTPRWRRCRAEDRRTTEPIDLSYWLRPLWRESSHLLTIPHRYPTVFQSKAIPIIRSTRRALPKGIPNKLVNDRSLTTVKVPGAGSGVLETICDFAIDRIARLLKDAAQTPYRNGRAGRAIML